MKNDSPNVVKFVSKEQILFDAAAWIIKQEEGMTEAQQREFELWLERSALHKELFLLVQEPILAANTLSNLSDIFPYQRRKQPPKAQSILGWWRGIPKTPVVSFIFCLCIVGLSQMDSTRMLVANIMDEQLTSEVAPFAQQYHTQIAQQEHFELPDNSTLTLNVDSKVRVMFNADRRVLYLDKGELHINVAHDELRPLSVVASNKTIVAVGTAFNVALKEQVNVELIVTEGKVTVSSIDKISVTDNDNSVPPLQKGNTVQKTQQVLSAIPSDMLVNKGEKVLLKANQTVTQTIAKDTLNKEQLNSRLSWQTGTLTFNGEDLDYVVNELSRYTGVQFTLKEQELKSMTIVARMKIKDLDNILFILHDSFDLNVEKSANNKVVMLSKR